MIGDPVAAAKQSEADGRLPFIYPEEFYNEYRTLDDGSQKIIEWVRIAKKGTSGNAPAWPERIKDLQRNPENPTWQVLRPYYERWKAGQSAPVNGTPLEAWLADAPLIKVLNGVNIRSVEDFSEISESDLRKLSIPGVLEKQKRARAFLEAQKSTSAVSSELAALRSENEMLKANIGELRALIEQHSIKRKPGRPRKEQVAA